MILAAVDRSDWYVYAAVVAGTAAAYLTLFELGRGREGHISALGVLGSILAIVCWRIERVLSRRLPGEWREVFAVPIRNSTIAARPCGPPSLLGWGRAGPCLLSSVPFLLLIVTLPGGRMAVSDPCTRLVGSERVRGRGPLGACGADAVGLLWPRSCAGGWGWLCGRWKPWVCQRLGHPHDLRLEFPPYHAAIVLAAASIGLRLDAILRLGEAWSARPWVPAALAVLSLLMLKPYPYRGWVDGFAGLLSLAVPSSSGPGLDNPMAWVLVVLTVALLWRVAQWGASPEQEAICRRLGIRFEDVAKVLGEWSTGLLLVAAWPRVSLIGTAVLAGSLGTPDFLVANRPIAWWEGLVAILLFGANLDVAGRAHFGVSPPLGPHVTATLLLWWLAIPASPLIVWLGLDPASVLPVLTALTALGSVAAGGRSADWYGFGLSLVAVVLTGGQLATATTATLFLATALHGLLAAPSPQPHGWPASALSSGVWPFSSSRVRWPAASAGTISPRS